MEVHLANGTIVFKMTDGFFESISLSNERRGTRPTKSRFWFTFLIVFHVIAILIIGN